MLKVRYTVTVQRKDQTMTKIVNDDSFTIGRSMDCTIPLSEDSISRVHLIVQRRQDQVWIEDKGSSNGTFVNNVRITANTPVLVVPTDKIRVGKSDYYVAINLHLDEKERTNATSTMPIAKAEDTSAAAAKSVHVSLNPNSNPQVIIAPKAKAIAPEIQKELKEQKEQRPFPKFAPKEEPAVPAAYTANAPQFEGERILHEAHKKAAQIIYEAEVQAEKRAQTIYVDAREKQAAAETYYQKKIQEAHKEVDAILHSFQGQGQELLEQARQYAREIREEIDILAVTLREKARKDAEMIVDEGREDAEVIRQEAYENAQNKAQQEAEGLITGAKREAEEMVGFAKMQADELLATARFQVETEFEDIKEAIAKKKKDAKELQKAHEEFLAKSQLEKEEFLAKTQSEKEEAVARAQAEQQEAEAKLAQLKEELSRQQGQYDLTQKGLEKAQAETTELHEKILHQQKTTLGLEHEIGKLYADSKNLERKNKELQESLGRFGLDIKSAEEQKRQIEGELIQHKSQIRERLEKEHQVASKESEERLQEAQLEMSKRLQKLERDMLEEIMERKDTLVKDIIVIIETRIASVLEPSKWDQVSGQIFEGISETIEGKAVTFTQEAGTPKQSASLLRKKKKENYRWAGAGAMAGLLVALLGFHTYNRILSDKNPMRTLAAEETRRRQEDLEKRKFNPVQVADIKDTYVDAVIYTSGYVGAYQNSDYQQKLYKAASAYLLKTWRVDEDKSIQVLSISSALIKELNEKRQGIHPDYVKDGIAKMRALEKDSLDRMKVILGSEVRLESYRRFEKKFFENEILKK